MLRTEGLSIPSPGTGNPADALQKAGNLAAQNGQSSQQVVFGFTGARKQRTSLSIQTKLEVIKYAEENPTVTQNKIASHFGIDRTTVSKVLKRKAQFIAEDSNGVKSECHSPSTPGERNDSLDLESPKTFLGDMNGLAGVIRNIASRQRKHGEAKRVSNDSPLNVRAKQASPSLKQHFPNLGYTLTSEHVPGYNHPVQQKPPQQLQHGDLYEKCESWFMKQKFTTASKKHEKDIIAYSCLISPLPLGIEECSRIIPAKFVKDEAMRWLQVQLQSNEAGLSMSTNLAGLGQELLEKYIATEEESLNAKLAELFPGTVRYDADSIRNVWVKYVYPNLGLFNKMSAENGNAVKNTQTEGPSRKRSKVAPPQNNNNTDTYSQFLTSLPLGLFEQVAAAHMHSPFLMMPVSAAVSSAFPTPLPVTSPLALTNHSPAMSEVQNYSYRGNGNTQTSSNDEVLDLSISDSTQDSTHEGGDRNNNTAGSPSNGGNIRGSRKRKMNLNPTRITHQMDSGEMDTDARGKVINIDRHPEMLRCLDEGAMQRNKSPNHNGLVQNDLQNRGQRVIEIVPDSFRNRENESRQPSQSSSNHLNCDKDYSACNIDSSRNMDNNNTRSQGELYSVLLQNVVTLTKQVAELQDKLRRQPAMDCANDSANKDLLDSNKGNRDEGTSGKESVEENKTANDESSMKETVAENGNSPGLPTERSADANAENSGAGNSAIDSSAKKANTSAGIKSGEATETSANNSTVMRANDSAGISASDSATNSTGEYKCSCACSNLNNNCDQYEQRISSLEQNLEAMQAKLDVLLSSSSVIQEQP